jgi:two-component system, NarL family, nitrate/nitrite sensor histidine kinase NarX
MGGAAARAGRDGLRRGRPISSSLPRGRTRGLGSGLNSAADVSSARFETSLEGGAGILGELASDLAGEGDLPGLLKRFLEPLLRMSGADAGAVRAISDDGDQLRLVSSVGLPESALLAEGSVHHRCGACGKAAAGDAPVWASELSGCARLDGIDAVHGDFRRMVAVPLRHRGRVLGTYSLFFSRGEGPGPEVMAVLKAVGELLGLALNNARLEREHLRSTVMHERQMMAAEVHDSIAQTLAFVRMRLPLIEEAVREHDDARSTRYLSDMRGAVGEAHASLRAIINEFRAPPDPRGLTRALQDRVGQLRERHGIEAEMVDHAPGLALSAAEEAQVLHIVSEALANIGRHAHATHAWLSLTLRDGRVEVRVEDDGCGLAADAAGAGHHGIEIMRERARRIGGELEIRPRHGVGTMLQLNFPVPRGVGR